MAPTRVCYLGAYDPTYPRNLILRRGLALHGAQVGECNVRQAGSALSRSRALLRQFPPLANRCDLILLAEFGQALAPVAWLLARRFRKRLVVDAFTSLYDTSVHDRGTVRPGSPAALGYRAADALAFRLADAILTDTRRNAQHYARQFGISAARFAVIPVGAPREWFDAGALTPRPPLLSGEGESGRRLGKPGGEGSLLVQFYGSYIPLHGVETILHAADRLRDQASLRFELIGRGQTYTAVRALAADLGLHNVTFRDPVPPADLPPLVARADIALGIFGTTDKALRVIPNKVYQALALGRALITADTPALREAFMPGEHLLGVPPGDPAALADAIRALAANPARRASFGAAGRARMAEAFDERTLGRLLLDAIG